MPIEVQENQGERRGPKRAPLVPIPADAPKRPDYKVLKADLDKIFEQVKVYRDQIEKIRTKEKETRDAKDDPRKKLRAEKDELFDSKKQIGNKISDLRRQRNDKMAKVKTAREKARGDVSEIRKLNRELGELLTPEAVDKKIKELEFKLETGGVSSIKGEKKVMLEIKSLQANRDKAASMKAKVDSVTCGQKTEEDLADDCKGLQRQIDEESIKFKTTIELIEAKNAEIAATSNSNEIKKIREEREGISQKITDSYAKIDAMKEEFEKKKKSYEEWQVTYDKLCQAERERRRKEREEADKIRAEKDKERELEIASIKRLNPHEEEINACETLIAYLKGKIAFAVKDERKAETKPAFDPTKNVVSGFAVLKKDDDDWLMGGKKKKKADKPKSAPKPKEAAPAKVKPVKHSHEKFGAFEKFGLKTPNNTDEVKNVIEELLAKKKHFESFKKTEKEAVAEEKAEREQKRLEREAAAAAAAAAAATEEPADEE